MIRRLAPDGARVFAAVIVGVAVARSAWAASSNGVQPPLAQTPQPGPYPWPTVDAPGGVTPAAPSPSPAPAPKPTAPKTAAPTEKRVEPAAPPPVAPKAPPAAPQTKALEPAAPKPPEPAATPAGTPSQFPSAAPTAAPAPVQATPPPPPVEPVPAPATETSMGAWGEALVQMNRDHHVRARLPWLAVDFRHRPISWLQLVAAAELEEANRFGLEQLQVQILPHPAFSLRFGLVLLPLGIINLWHVPTTFLTVDRPLTDRLIIPTTWRELGAGVFGALGDAARYDFQVVAGLDAAGFSGAAPLWGGRGNGRAFAVNDAAFVGRLELGHAPEGFAVGGGAYWGGASGGHAELSGVSVSVFEADARYRGGGFDLRAEAAEFFISNSYRVNEYLGLINHDTVPSSGRGLYAQAGYDVLATNVPGARQGLVFFAGFENVNPRSRLSPNNYNPPTITPPGGTPPNSPSPARSFVRGGICYLPIPAVAIKTDVQVALDPEGAEPGTLTTRTGAPGKPKTLPDSVVDAARGQTWVSVAVAFAF